MSYIFELPAQPPDTPPLIRLTRTFHLAPVPRSNRLIVGP